MSSEKHQNLGLHKWSDKDTILRSEWNENFEKIDKGTISKNGFVTEVFTSTENQLVFTLSNTYDTTDDLMTVIIDGVEQFAPENYTKTNNTSITLSESLPEGVSVRVRYHKH